MCARWLATRPGFMPFVNYFFGKARSKEVEQEWASGLALTHCPRSHISGGIKNIMCSQHWLWFMKENWNFRLYNLGKRSCLIVSYISKLPIAMPKKKTTHTMGRGLVSQKIHKSERHVLRSFFTSLPWRHGFWWQLLGLSLWFIGKVGLHCILEEPKAELSKFQEHLLSHNSLNTKKCVQIHAIILTYQCWAFGKKFNKWNCDINLLLW